MGSNITTSSTVSPAGSEGSKVVAIYQERRVRVFSILDAELKSISIMNGASTIFFGIGVYFLPNLEGLTLKNILDIPFVSLTIPLIFFAGGIISTLVNRCTISTLKKESITRKEDS